MTIFDMGREEGRQQNDPFGISPIDMTRTDRFVDFQWYSIMGHTDRGAAYEYVVSNEGSKLTYYRPKHWTQEEWDEFCDEMEEDIGGDQASNE